MSTPFSSFPGFDGSLSNNVPPATLRSSKEPKKGDSETQSTRRKKDRRDRDVRPQRQRSRERRSSRSPTPRHYDNDERRHEKLHGKRPDYDERAFDTAPTFFIDRRGDPLNLQYGRPHSGDVPKYRHIAGNHPTHSITV